MPTPDDLPLLEELQRVLDREIPMCAKMGVRVVLESNPATSAGLASEEGAGAGGLRMAMPLEGNHNHQRTAFAGSLNALCTVAGWGAAWLELRRLLAAGPATPADAPPLGEGAIVIRRSTIKYHEPVATPVVTARCLPPSPAIREHFAGMLLEKGQSKLDLEVEIAGTTPDRPAVALKGSYVVLPIEEAAKGGA